MQLGETKTRGLFLLSRFSVCKVFAILWENFIDKPQPLISGFIVFIKYGYILLAYFLEIFSYAKIFVVDNFKPFSRNLITLKVSDLY